VLVTRFFDSRQEATAYFRTLLHRYCPKQRVSDVDGADLEALLKRHAEYQEKVVVGIAHFEVMSAEFGTECFRPVRVDGTGEAFSYLHCIARWAVGRAARPASVSLVSSSLTPPQLLRTIARRLEDAPGLAGVCAACFEASEWRYDQLAKHIVEWLPEFALNEREFNALTGPSASGPRWIGQPGSGTVARGIRLMIPAMARRCGTRRKPSSSVAMAAGCGF
jgi:Protein of unknown function (DUF3223)